MSISGLATMHLAYKLPLTIMVRVVIILFSVYCCNDDKITVCDINHTRGTPPTHISSSTICLWSEFITSTLRMGNQPIIPVGMVVVNATRLSLSVLPLDHLS